MNRNRRKRIEQQRRGRAAGLLWERKQSRTRRAVARAHLEAVAIRLSLHF